MKPLVSWVTCSVVLLCAAHARAQVVQGCQLGQFLDRTAVGADRQLEWDFSIASDPERCLQVRAGQTVLWSGDFDNHPLGGSGGDTPNPITLHQNGSVTFQVPGTFGYVCLAHSSMRGAIQVLPALPSSATPAPALSPALMVALAAALMTFGVMLLRARSANVHPVP